MRGQQRAKCRRAGQYNSSAPLLEQAGIANELERIPQTLSASSSRLRPAKGSPLQRGRFCGSVRPGMRSRSS